MVDGHDSNLAHGAHMHMHLVGVFYDQHPN